MSRPRMELVEALSTCSLAQQVVEHEAQRVNQELERSQRHNTRLKGKIKLMEDELKFVKLDLSKAQAANRSYQLDIDRLHSECRALLWKNFDLEVENDGLKHTLETYRHHSSRQKSLTSQTHRATTTSSTSSHGASKLNGKAQTTTMETSMTSLNTAGPSSARPAHSHADAVARYTARYLNELDNYPPLQHAPAKPAPARKSSSSNYYYKDVTWSEVTPSTSRTSNVSEHHHGTSVRFDPSATRGFDPDLPPPSMSTPTSHVKYEQRDLRTETRSHRSHEGHGGHTSHGGHRSHGGHGRSSRF